MTAPRRSPTLLIANPSGDVYGSDLQMLQTVSAMRSHGWRVVVVMPDDGPLVAMLHEHGAEVRFTSFPVLRRASVSGRGIATLTRQSALALPGLRRALREVSPDVVYANTVTIPWWIAASRAAQIPVICHVHEAESQDRRSIRVALNSPLLAANSLIAISTSAVEAITRDLPRLKGRTRLIYNGVPGPDGGDEPMPAPEPFRLAVVGRLSPRKAPDVALEAVALLRRSGRSVRLEVCGTPFDGYQWYEKQLKERAAHSDLAGAVHFSGYVSPVWPALARAHVLLAPSLREPFGNAVVEAQLAGRPVVGAAAMGHLETIKHEQTGLLVPPGDPVGMAAAVERLMDDRDFAGAIARRARECALERYALQRYRDEVFEHIASFTARTAGAEVAEGVPA